jgi:DUF1680 family protein
MERQRATLIPWALERTRGAVEHLQGARDFLAGRPVTGQKPQRYIDSDLFKVIEGAAYLLQQQPDPTLESRLDELAELIAGAQEPDGYLYPSHTVGVGTARDLMGDGPYEFVVHSHELYNMGHLYEAAVAYFQATGKRTLLQVAEKNAQHVERVFFVGDPNYNEGKPVMQAPGHEEIELALVKLFRATGDRRYLDMARRFLEIRGVTYVPHGEGVMAPTYAQQQDPVLQQTQPVGHAVRAMYLYSAMADVGTLTGDPRYAAALDRIWSDLTDTRMHITGGLGASHGIEGFGPPYELPNAEAYNETCAAVGNVLFNYRMFLLHRDARYLDVAEVALLNNVLAGVDLAGDRFFYVNPLASDGRQGFNHGSPERAPWFDTACCPTNLARLIPQLPGMAYALDDQQLYVTLYADSRARLRMNEIPVEIVQTTTYPNDGAVRIEVAPDKPVRFQLLLRIPTWTGPQFVPGELYPYDDPDPSDVVIRVNGQEADWDAAPQGFAVIDRQWQAGDRVELQLAMPLRICRCHPEVAANRQRIAFTRGPLVLCAEGVDNGDPTGRFFFDPLPDTGKATVDTTSAFDVPFIQVTLPAQVPAANDQADPTRVVLIPYYAWNNRGPTSMTVWFPVDRRLAEMK